MIRDEKPGWRDEMMGGGKFILGVGWDVEDSVEEEGLREWDGVWFGWERGLGVEERRMALLMWSGWWRSVDAEGNLSWMRCPWGWVGL